MYGVALVGHDAGGKSTIAEYISELVKPSLTVAFANELKEDLDYLGIPVWEKPYSVKVRNLLRLYGETQMELNGDLYWVERTFTTLDEYLNDLLDYEHEYPNVVICDDMRHHHELRAWVDRFPQHLIIVLTNNQMTNQDYNYRSVVEVEEIIQQARYGNLPNSIVVHNVFSESGLSEDIKLAIQEKIDGLSIHTSVRGTQL